MITKATPFQTAGRRRSHFLVKRPCCRSSSLTFFQTNPISVNHVHEGDPDRRGEASSEKGRAGAELTFVMLLLGMCFGSFPSAYDITNGKAASMSVGHAKLL